MHDFKYHEGQVQCLDFHPHEFLLATGIFLVLLILAPCFTSSRFFLDIIAWDVDALTLVLLLALICAHRLSLLLKAVVAAQAL